MNSIAAAAKNTKDFPFMPERRLFRKRRRTGAIAAFIVGELGAALFGMVAYALSANGFTELGIILGTFTVVMMVFIASLGSAMFITTSDISVSREGIHLHILPRVTHTIDRAQLKSVRVRQTMRELPYRSDELSEIYIVQAHSLSPLYALASLYFGCWLQPLFVITPDHENHLFLVTTIEMLRDSA